MIRILRTNAVTLVAVTAIALAALISAGMTKPPDGQPPITAARTQSGAVAHSLPHWMMAAGLLGSPAISASSSVPPGSAYTGVADFQNPGAFTFTAPEGVTTVLVQVYGAGGGGGTGTKRPGGGGGGGGALAISVVTVTPGATYTINVGAGGAAGAKGMPGSDGADTSFVDPTGLVLVGAGGGQGGEASGVQGAGGQVIGTAMIGRAGGGSKGTTTNGGGEWLVPIADGADGNIVSAGGSGNGTLQTLGTAGGNGYAFIAW